MSTPDPAHIDAVARVVSTRRICEHEERALGSTHVAYNCDKCDALALLTSTDPAVHAAMLDALTRQGVLTRAWSVIGDDDGDEWIVDALWAERDEAEKWTHTHGGHVVGRLHEADWHEVTQ